MQPVIKGYTVNHIILSLHNIRLHCTYRLRHCDIAQLNKQSALTAAWCSPQYNMTVETFPERSWFYNKV